MQYNDFIKMNLLLTRMSVATDGSPEALEFITKGNHLTPAVERPYWIPHSWKKLVKYIEESTMNGKTDHIQIRLVNGSVVQDPKCLFIWAHH